MKKIFISWSKKRSEEFAKIVKSTVSALILDMDTKIPGHIPAAGAP